MKYPSWKYILLILFAVVPIFGGAIVGIPLLSVLWTAGLVCILPFVVLKIVKNDAPRRGEALEKQIERVRMITGNAPPVPNTNPPPLPAPILPQPHTNRD